MAHRPIEEPDLYRIFEEVAEWSWDQVATWKPFARDTVGKQLITSVDSINANLVEGDGRYSPQDAIRFFRIARASAREARLWLRRAQKRGLVCSEAAESRIEDLTRATRMLNLLINYRRSSSDDVRETVEPYGSQEPSPWVGTLTRDENPFTCDQLECKP